MPRMAMNQVDYYRHEIIQRKLEEYCSPVPPQWMGAPAEDIVHGSAKYWVGFGEALLWEGRAEPFCTVNKSEPGFYWMLEKGLDFFRSVWDSEFSLVNIDIEYYNIGEGGHAYVHPRRALGFCEPVWRRVVRILSWGFGITPLVFQTGNGVQVTFCVPRDSYADRLLQGIATLEWSLEAKYRYRLSANRPRGVPVSQGLAFEGIGRIVEYLYHKAVFELSAEGHSFPVHVGDVNPGAPFGRAEAVNFDCSLYFDPLFMRDTRAPFSTHQKHKAWPKKVGEWVSRTVPIQISIPRLVRDWHGNFFEIDFDTAVGREEHPGDHGVRRHYDAAIELAHQCDCRVPIYDWQVVPLIEEYLASPLRIFHEWFDAVDHEPWWERDTWYRHIDWHAIAPPCVADPLAAGDSARLLNPTYIRHITRALMGAGFDPKHIAGILAMKYSDFGGWDKYDHATRANGWVRTYAGQALTLLDPLADMDCSSCQSLGLCTVQGPCMGLAGLRDALDSMRRDWFHHAQITAADRR